MPPAMSEDGSAPALGGPPALPECIKDPEIPKTGWERIRELFQPNEQGSYPEEVQNVAKGALTGLMLGWVYGGIPAARLSKERFIQQSQADVYCHRVEAVRAAHNAALRGFIRYGWRWGWRVAAFATIFNSVSTGLSVYRDEVVLSHYAAAGGVTGGLFRIHLGLRGLLGGSLIGALLGVPAGALISGLQALSGENVREKKQRERRHLYHHKLEEWDARLQITDEVLQEMGAAGIESAETHVEKIDELLQLPRNPESEAEEG
ncbi:complex I assembly factor TIMMDC1, mitochondrial [Spea bombifrons]|uniref:complex I assembly factor TIMMDC1, mitochondrial n=1 Tax=Spea bombifrons TaxID=233779 RepID=UPI00234B7BEF|nr:complex I assembly factor TIMMDC1, mitochondrial [Spea bombifrons]XP_053312359.1 complex I assembly factor TIMMDC1, mitochondrial [Spea bombifrons]